MLCCAVQLLTVVTEDNPNQIAGQFNDASVSALMSMMADSKAPAHVRVGIGLERATSVAAELNERSLALAATLDRTEGADFIESALELSESQNVLDAILQTRAVTNGKTLLDLIG